PRGKRAPRCAAAPGGSTSRTASARYIFIGSIFYGASRSVGDGHAKEIEMVEQVVIAAEDLKIPHHRVHRLGDLNASWRSRLNRGRAVEQEQPQSQQQGEGGGDGGPDEFEREATTPGRRMGIGDATMETGLEAERGLGALAPFIEEREQVLQVLGGFDVLHSKSSKSRRRVS